jgi:hypothetical protein
VRRLGRPRRFAGGSHRFRKPPVLPAPGGARGWRAAGSPPEFAPRSGRSPRTARRTCRAGRTPAVRRGSACPGPPAVPGRPSRRAVLVLRVGAA